MNNYKSFTIGMLVVPLALLALGIAVASSVVTPNTFVAGTAAIASQVNANFTAHAAAINDNDTRVTGLESPTRRGTVLMFGRVLGESLVPDFDTGAYTSDGSPLPAITDLGTGNYLVALPNGEAFDHGNHGVVITPMEFGSARTYTIEQGAGGTIEVHIWDDAGAATDEDFQITVFND